MIVSVTRTEKPGFLDKVHRINVMLTRCRAGMVIVSNRSFVSGRGRHTLLGKLVKHWMSLHPRNFVWIDWRRVTEGSVGLPGVPAPHPTRLGAVSNATHSHTGQPSRPSPQQVPVLSQPPSEQMAQLSLRSSTTPGPGPVYASDLPELSNSAAPSDQPQSQGVSAWLNRGLAFLGRKPA